MVGYEVVKRVAHVTLNQPAKRNALSRAMLEALGGAMRQAQEDASAGVVVLRAEGPVFSAGHDLKELASAGEADLAELFRVCSRVMEGIRLLHKPVIAQVQGLATAAGCQLVASCDLVVASDRASFATPGVKIGLFCTTPAVPLARAIPTKKAFEMLFTGAPISAQEAERLGLVNRVVAHDRLAEETMALAEQILASSAEVLALGKQAFYGQLGCDRTTAYAMAERVMVSNAQLADAREGIRAFLEKRPPQWKSEN